MAPRRNRTLLWVLAGVVVLVGVLLSLQWLRSSRSAPQSVEAAPLAEPDALDVEELDVDSAPVADIAPVTGAPSGLRALLGEVTDPSGTPVIGASVAALLEDGSTEARTTDAEGVFTLDALRAGILRVRFSAAGYKDVDVDAAKLPKLAEAFWSQKLVPSLSEGTGRIEGVVVDDRGAPVTSFRLMAAPIEPPDRRRRPRNNFTQVDDGNGAFSRDVTGPTTIAVVAPGFRPSDELVMDVDPGKVERVRIALQRSNALSGRVTNALTGAPIAGALVGLDRVRGIEPVVTGEDGRYAIPSLPLEKASVIVRAEGFVDLTSGGVEGGRSRDEVLDVALTPSSGVAGATEVVGIGVGVRGGPDGVRVTEVFANGPANGLLEKGDVIVEVDGVSMVGKELRAGMSAIRGESGSTIRLRVTKKDGTSKSVSMERARVSIPEG